MSRAEFTAALLLVIELASELQRCCPDPIHTKQAEDAREMLAEILAPKAGGRR